MSFYDRLLKWAEKVCEKDEKEAQSTMRDYAYDGFRHEVNERALHGETCKCCKFCKIKFGWGWTYDKYYCTKHNIDLENDDSGYYTVPFLDSMCRAKSCDDYKYNFDGSYHSD